MIKRTLLKTLQRFGYNIVKTNAGPDEKDLSVLSEMTVLAQLGILPDIPSEDSKIRVRLLSKLLGTNPSEGLFIIDALAKTASVEGDICEFGVAQGATSAMMANEVKNTKKNIWLFDSFKGLPKPTEKDLLKDDIFNLGSMSAYEGTMACEANQVIRRLEQIKFPKDRINIVSGFIEETIRFADLPTKVSFAFVDFDFYEPIRLALNFLDTVLSKGGVIIVDDYDFFSTGAKTAVDEYIANERGKYKLLIPPPALGHFAVLTKL